MSGRSRPGLSESGSQAMACTALSCQFIVLQSASVKIVLATGGGVLTTAGTLRHRAVGRRRIWLDIMCRTATGGPPAPAHESQSGGYSPLPSESSVVSIR
jgi:hypothetical protein